MGHHTGGYMESVSHRQKIQVRNRWIGESMPTYIIGEIGINHNGSLEIAKKMIDGAASSGCDAVKFQKRTPEVCVPKDQWDIERDTPWGRMTYIDYRHRMEFTREEYSEIDSFAEKVGSIGLHLAGTSPLSTLSNNLTPYSIKQLRPH